MWARLGRWSRYRGKKRWSFVANSRIASARRVVYLQGMRIHCPRRRSGSTRAGRGRRERMRESWMGWVGMPGKVGQKRANAWGLYDMHGNVSEWCSDWYGDYPSGSVTDPAGASSGFVRVCRGGSWSYPAASARSAVRSGHPPGYRGSFLGFRVALTPSSR
jgi:formylglycine-generating enzyme required for sulfatase activity